MRSYLLTWSRDAASKDSDPIRPSEGIKAYALCPAFADTQLVRDSIKMYGHSKIEDLEKVIKTRVMDVSEVGHAFDLRLLGALKGQNLWKHKSQHPKLNVKVYTVLKRWPGQMFLYLYSDIFFQISQSTWYEWFFFVSESLRFLL